MTYTRKLLSLLLLLGLCLTVQTFTPLSPRPVILTRPRGQVENNEEASSPSAGVVELGDDESGLNAEPQDSDLPKAVSGPLFISQGEVDPDTLNPDFSDAKQTRVILYTILSLLPVLLLIPFMLGRDFIPADVLPPVDIN